MNETCITPKLVKKAYCTGCGLCEFECPKGAISMEPDTYGFFYPKIRTDICIHCGKCERTCPALNPVQKNKEIRALAAAVDDRRQLLNSASGGVFIALAEHVISMGGAVYGAVMSRDEEVVMRVEHERADSMAGAERMQRSKYVQSSIRRAFPSIREDLKAGRTVLFSGTPCQAAAIRKAFPSEEKLLIVDIICHGVPSQQMFTDYLKQVEKHGRSVKGFNFRSKESGWGLCAILETENRHGVAKKERIPCQVSS